jgi:glycosyltransferase involved in cell wall biosynthesis
VIKSSLTIAIPTLNRADMVAALVRVCLSQTVLPCTIIVSDDASDDDTLMKLAKLQHPNLKVIRQRPRIGMIANWNACLEACESDWFVLVSDDDMVAPDFVEQVENQLAATPEIDLLIVRGRIVDRLTREINDNQPPPGISGEIDFARDLLPHWLDYSFVLPFASVIFRTAALRAGGGFVTSFPYASDAATWLPIAVRGRCAFYPVAKVDCIVHEGMATRSFNPAALIDDVIRLTHLVNNEVGVRFAYDQKFVAQIGMLSNIYLRHIFGHMMITSARRGVSKLQLLLAWRSCASQLPFFGVGAMSLGAVLVPQGLIQVVGWPYRKWVSLRRRFLRRQRLRS